MHKTWLIARYEYRRNVFTRQFILVMFSAPLVVALIIGLGALIDALENNSDAIGYVDLSGFLADPLPAPRPGSSPDSPSPRKLVPLVAYASEAEARAALEAKEIQAFYLIRADYLTTNHVDLVYLKQPSGNALRQFWDFMQINQLHGLPENIASRAVAGSNLTIRWPADASGGGREFSARTFMNTFVPIIVGLATVFLLLSGSGYLMSAVVEERENRTMEILYTSLSPNQLMTGKVLGILGVTLTQLAAWAGFGVLAVIIGGQVLDISLLQNMQIDLRLLATMAAVSIPPFVLLAALMVTIGSTVAEAQQAQQMTGLFIFPYMIPLWLIQSLVEHPQGPLAVGLSLFPPTTVTTFGMRLAFSRVPTWQVAASIALSSLCAAGALWLAGRAFRLGMLRYGQPLKLAELFSRPRATGVTGGSRE